MIRRSSVSTVVLLVLAVFLVTSFIAPVPMTSAAASYPTPQLITSKPAEITMSRPAYLQPTAIPGLGTQIMRISNAATFGTGERYYRHFYAKSQPWNSDESRIILGHDSGNQYFLDGQTYAYQFTRTNVPHAPRWSTIDPNKLFGFNGSNLVSYSVSGNSQTIIQSFSGEGCSTLWIGRDEGNMSDDSRYVPIVCDLSANSNYLIIIYDVISDVEIGRRTIIGDIDWASMSPSGTYVVVNNRVPANYEVYDKQMNLLRTLSIDGGGHADMGYDTSGNEVIVSGHFEGGPGVIITSTRLDTGAVREELPTDSQSGVHLPSAYHISCRNTARPGYCYISTFAFSSALGAYMFNEIFALRLDGTGTVERFSQNFVSELPVADLEYSRGPMAVPNHDGSRVLFASDWEDASSNAIIYDYVAGVQVLQSATPTPTPTPTTCTPTTLNVSSAVSDTGFAYIIGSSFGTPADNGSSGIPVKTGHRLDVGLIFPMV